MLNRLKISLVLAPLALVMLVGIYIYSLWSQERIRNSEIPVEAIDAMNRDLLKFHQKRGSFPAKLQDLEGVVWEKKERNYLSEGRSMIHRNYFYLYTKVDPHRYSLWAIPVGRSRKESPTWFLSGTLSVNRRWKGGSLDVDDISNLSDSPSSTQLGMLGLTEQLNPIGKEK